MERVRRGRWRLTFVAWSTLLAIWAVVTVAMDFDTLAVARWIAHQRADRALALIVVVIALPLLVDAARNVHRTYRLHQRRSRQERAGATWSERVPVATPRRVEGEGLGDLTRRERLVVEQGQLALGVVEHHGDLTSLRYTTPWGREITTRPVAVRGERPRAGVEAPILFEPGARMGVAPSLHGLTFAIPVVEDGREALAPSSIPATSIPARWEIPLHASLHPVERASGVGATEVGRIQIDDEVITLAFERGDPVSLRLDRPFRVTLGCFLLPGGMAEVDVALEPQVEGAYRAGTRHALRFKTELPQRRVAPSLEQRRRDVASVAPRDFDRLWALLVACAADDQLAERIALA